MSSIFDSTLPSGSSFQCENTVSKANACLRSMMSSRNSLTPDCDRDCQVASSSRSLCAHAGIRGGVPVGSGRIDIVSRSALTSGICSMPARRWYHKVDFPEPLCPARTTATVLASPSSSSRNSCSIVGGNLPVTRL